ENVTLDETTLIPLGNAEYRRREEMLSNGQTDDPFFALSKQFAAADIIVVAAPFWDMGIPSKLKIYFEDVSVSGIAFACNEKGDFVGLCKAEHLVYITTRGMDITDGSVMEQASPYLKALAMFFGIPNFSMVSAISLDTKPDEAERRVDEAIIRARNLAKVEKLFSKKERRTDC
ncbi:MAG: NAD(P)H-dependent oxidoreductase, partial [Firmicutes bacterium]|nr:NAD(P)H-dependent oxidoreductase [Bacillota bacterium]